MSEITFTNGFAIGGSRSRALTRCSVAQLLDRFVFASLLALIALVVIPYGTVEPWWISLYECASFGLGALWILEGLITGLWNVKGKHLLLPFVFLVGFTFLQSVSLPSFGIVSSDPFETRLVFLKLLAFAINGARSCMSTMPLSRCCTRSSRRCQKFTNRFSMLAATNRTTRSNKSAN